MTIDLCVCLFFGGGGEGGAFMHRYRLCHYVFSSCLEKSGVVHGLNPIAASLELAPWLFSTVTHLGGGGGGSI